ncbi:hypothetical protein MLD38_026274 [Melastoma candidum]|uniref:Uncharacterized protein n=1 Tax=Melastoma candidum TaxID=119954 RepID=A0ACB9NY24_9MYRT|nr:hypothetical protein MLD38_026274 [Melastoma candidum]
MSEPEAISFCCSSCRYPFNLSSSSQVDSSSSRRNKSSKKGVVTFLVVDLSRFTQVDEVKCLPVSIGSDCSKTKLLCRKCGVHVGYGYEYSPGFCGLKQSESCRKFSMKIAAIQPCEEC